MSDEANAIEAGAIVTVGQIAAPHGFETIGARLGDSLPTPLVRLRQVHGAEVLVIDEATDLAPFAAEHPADRPAADGLITRLPEIALTIATADCAPVLVHDPAHGVVAAAHAGWRGIALGVIPVVLGTMAREFGTHPEACAAAIGPCIGAAVYRVGADVRTAFVAAGVGEGSFAGEHTDETGRTTWQCDLRAAAAAQLRACGLDGGRIGVVAGCTFTDENAFYSYRRQGEAAGRMMSGIALPG